MLSSFETNATILICSRVGQNQWKLNRESVWKMYVVVQCKSACVSGQFKNQCRRTINSVYYFWKLYFVLDTFYLFAYLGTYVSLKLQNHTEGNTWTIKQELCVGELKTEANCTWQRRCNFCTCPGYQGWNSKGGGGWAAFWLTDWCFPRTAAHRQSYFF